MIKPEMYVDFSCVRKTYGMLKMTMKRRSAVKVEIERKKGKKRSHVQCIYIY